MADEVNTREVKARRCSCERCRRPLSHCLCAYIPVVGNQTRVLVLQHPDEARHPLNTARLAVLGLQQAELWTGEEFAQLPDLIGSVERVFLLFPAAAQKQTKHQKASEGHKPSEGQKPLEVQESAELQDSSEGQNSAEGPDSSEGLDSSEGQSPAEGQDLVEEHRSAEGQEASEGQEPSDRWEAFEGREASEDYERSEGLEASVAHERSEAQEAFRPAPAELDNESTLLIVPDGTWRKARRIVNKNPVLSTLPRLSLSGGEPSAYRVRKTREPAAVSTIEAIVRALSMLEPGQDFKPLLKPFNVLVEQQIQAMGAEVFRRNYSA